MPSTPYDLVKDDQDLRIPLHAEQAFFQGITFQAKLIGWQDVPRPNSRTEIVQAMRRIRYECKVQNLKKPKVKIQISVDGVKIAMKKKKKKKKNWNNDFGADDKDLMHHPIYRIFYVSHDNSDLQIFSYIARDGSTDTFKCLVFKSNKKSQAIRIVRTIGQAFEVCHKFNFQKNSMDNDDYQSELHGDGSEKCSVDQNSDDGLPKKDIITISPEPQLKQRPTHLDLMSVPSFKSKSSSNNNDDKYSSSPVSTSKEIQQLRDQLEQQALQTRQALSQLMLVREQLISETNARIEAQARTQQLLQQNRELLEHLSSFGGYNENTRASLTSANIEFAPQLSPAAKVARWFQQLNSNPTTLSHPESGFISGDSRSERNLDDQPLAPNDNEDMCGEFLSVEDTSNLWRKLGTKKSKKLLGLRLGTATTF